MNSLGIKEYPSTTIGYFLVPSFIKEKTKMAKIKYNEDFDSSIFKVTRVDNCKNGCRLSQISFVDDKNTIYKTVKAGRTSIEKLINFHYNVKDSPDIIVHLDEADGVEFTTANSIESKSARGAPDKWTISKVEDPEEELYRIKIVRGGKQGFNRDFLINKHTKDCISEAIYNHLIEHLTKTTLDKAEERASKLTPESLKEEKQEEIKQEEKTLTTAQKNDNNDCVDLGEAINTILKVEGLSKEDLSKKENFSKKFAIYGLMYPTQAKQFENRYKIKVSVDTYTGLRKFFE